MRWRLLPPKTVCKVAKPCSHVLQGAENVDGSRYLVGYFRRLDSYWRMLLNSYPLIPDFLGYLSVKQLGVSVEDRLLCTVNRIVFVHRAIWILRKIVQ